MAIRIKDGDLPKSGRLTMPRGTYLSSQAPFSNPATAASGQLGGGGGTLPPTPQINPLLDESSYALGQARYNPLQPAGDALKQVWKALTNVNQGMINAYNNQNLLSVDEVRARFGQGAANYVQFFQGLQTPKSQQTSAFKAPEVKQNDFVGQDVGAYPAQLTLSQLKSMLPGNPSFESVNALMQSKGYSYIPYGGGFFAKTGQAAPASQQPAVSASGVGNATSGELDARGRPQYVDPTQLERGERVTAASGVTFVGGQDYTNPAGQTVSQYAVTIPGKGDRWKSSVKQDKEGNWVRVYYQTYGKANTKRGRRLRAQRAEREAEQQAAVQQQVAPAVEPPVNTQQLVNLRAAYG